MIFAIIAIIIAVIVTNMIFETNMIFVSTVIFALIMKINNNICGDDCSNNCYSYVICDDATNGHNYNVSICKIKQ